MCLGNESVGISVARIAQLVSRVPKDITFHCYVFSCVDL